MTALCRFFDDMTRFDQHMSSSDAGISLHRNLYLCTLWVHVPDGRVQVARSINRPPMPTVTPELRKSKADKKGHCPVWIRISGASDTRYTSAGFKLHPRYWNEAKREVRASHDQHEDLNALVKKKVAEAEAEILRMRLLDREPTPSQIKRKVAYGRAGSDFYSYAERSISQMERKGQAESAKRYRHIIFAKLQGHTGSRLAFDQIDLSLLREWETALVEKGNMASTVATAFRAFRAVYNKAEAEGLTAGLVNPFRQFKSAAIPRPSKTKLTDAEMRAIETVELKVGSPAWHARNAFVFAFYCAGMRFKDVCLLERRDFAREGDGWRLRYATSKTHRAFALKLPSQAVEVAQLYDLEDGRPDDFLFPFLRGADLSTAEELRRVKDSRNTAVNKQLKAVAKLAGLKTNVSFHIARHSFADLARVRGIDLHTISKALGHSSIKVTEGYLAALDQRALDNALRNLFDTNT
jgi:integrase/recombinase XerD